MSLSVFFFSRSAVLNSYTHIYDAIVLVTQCLQTSHTTLNSTECLLGSTSVVTPQMLLAVHKAQTVSYRLYHVWANEDNRHWNNSFLLSCRFLSECRAWYCPHKAHRMPTKPLVQCACTFIQFVRLLPGCLKLIEAFWSALICGPHKYPLPQKKWNISDCN